jgi:uncharacterized damage-inducible protein DinB
MSETNFFAESLGHWRYIRSGLIAEADNIPEDKFDFRPSPSVKSVHELLQHILEGSMMMTGVLSSPEPSFQGKGLDEFFREFSERARDAQGKTELMSLLKGQIEEGVERFDGVGHEAMMGPVVNFDGSTWTRMQWFFHAMTEEMYHRGQITTYARIMGLVPALTQTIEASKA